MKLPPATDRWLAGWIELLRHDAVPGYATRGRLARFGLDLAVLARALTVSGTWFAALLAAALGLAAQVLVWQLDLDGWQRDAVLCLPVVLVAPWVAAGRRRQLEALLAAADVTPATPVTDGACKPRESPALGPACGPECEQGPEQRAWLWQRVRRAATQGRALAPRQRWWPSLAWRCWRRWRSRASATPRA